MKKRITQLSIFFIFLYLYPSPPAVFGQTKTPSAASIIENNIKAVAKERKIQSIKNLSFRIVMKDYREVVTEFFSDSTGRMKMVVGKPPLVERITVVDNHNIREKNFLTGGVLPPVEKVSIRCLASLISGAFSLKNFKGRLHYKGIKSYGTARYYVLSMKEDSHLIQFFLDCSNFHLKRMVIEGRDLLKRKYQSMYDYGGHKKIHGLTIPSMWYHSYLGPGGEPGGNNKIENFQINRNIKLKKFRADRLHFGSVTLRNNTLHGNAVGAFFRARTGVVVMATNIRWKDIEPLELKHADELLVTVGKESYTGYFFPDKSINVPRQCIKAGVILFGDISAPYLGFLMIGKRFMKYDKELPLLLEVSVKKKIEIPEE